MNLFSQYRFLLKSTHKNLREYEGRLNDHEDLSAVKEIRRRYYQKESRLKNSMPAGRKEKKES